MKKLYFNSLLAAFLLLISAPASAAVKSMTELFGKYKGADENFRVQTAAVLTKYGARMVQEGQNVCIFAAWKAKQQI